MLLSPIYSHDQRTFIVDAIFLGDGVKIHSISIENNQIAVDITTHGPNHRICCPTQRIVQSFVL